MTEVALGAAAPIGPNFKVGRLPTAAASTNPTVVQAGIGRVYRIIGKNSGLADRTLKLYDKATAPTVGTDAPRISFPLTMGQSFNFDIMHGLSFVNGIAFALTSGSSDTDTGALTAGDVVSLNILYL